LKARLNQREGRQTLSDVRIPLILSELLQLLSDEGILGISSDRETLRIITIQSHLFPFLCQQLDGDSSSQSLSSLPTDVDIKILNTILQSASANQLLCKIPTWKWKIALDFIRKESLPPESAS
jgi:hypothetical protein